MTEFQSELGKTFLSNITLFESNGRFKLCGTNDGGDKYRVLSLEIDEFGGPKLSEHHETFDSRSLRRLLSRDSGSDSFQVRIRAVAFLGLVCLLDDDWHMHFATNRTAVGIIGGHTVYQVSAASLLPLKKLPETALSPLTQKYRSLYNSVDLTKDFYYSDSLDLTRTVQSNATQANSTINSFYCWNFAHLQNALKIKCPEYWLTPIIHGFYEQEIIEIPEENKFLMVLLLCRRSRLMAGTRYQRRGLSPSARGEVANEVQSELFVVAAKEWGTNTLYAGMVLHRGSIPLFWGHDQDKVSQPKPDIIFTKNDPEFAVTEIHFKRMLSDYSSPIVCLNLIRQGTHKESSICSKYDLALHSLAVNMRFRHNDIVYLKYDFLAEQKGGRNITEAIQTLADVYILKIGFLLHNRVARSSDQPRRIQHGVFRVNCIDCLDRTNFAQYCLAQRGFALLLEGLGFEDAVGWENSYPKISSALKELFMHHGDRIANQYAGSGAMHKHAFSVTPTEESLEQEEQEPEVENKLTIDQVRGKVLSTFGKLKTNAANNNAITAIKRYYSNAVTDRAKNQAIQLFLGHFRPISTAIPLWDLPADGVCEEELSEDLGSQIPFMYPWLEQSTETQSTETQTMSNRKSENYADDLIDMSFVNGNSV